VARFDARLRLHGWLLAAAVLISTAAFVGTRGFASVAVVRPSGLVGPGLVRSPSRRAAARWIAGWNGSPQPATRRVLFPGGFENQTVRNIVLTSAAGNMARVRFSNAYGQQPLDIGRAVLGKAQGGGAVARRSDARLTFDGRPSVVIPPGASVVSDPVRLRVRRLERLAVSIFLPHATGLPTDHGTARQTNYVAAGDHAFDSTAVAFRIRTPSWYFVTAVDVRSSSPRAGTLVAFGDSITDGTGSRADDNARWPNDLARRLDSLRGATLSVVDAGISGNQLLRWTRCCGASGVARFRRDAMSVPAVIGVIVLEGINDIGANRKVSTEQIIGGYQRLIALAHAAGVKIFAGTLTPFRGARYWTRAGEVKREAVNTWIRRRRAFDGVIDFARAVADPSNPQFLNPAYDSGDHLHPNDAGYRAMANAINLTMLLPAHWSRGTDRRAPPI
jgi:lysophospholipase L1-like esterase